MERSGLERERLRFNIIETIASRMTVANFNNVDSITTVADALFDWITAEEPPAQASSVKRRKEWSVSE
jgi:hypothetical protein